MINEQKQALLKVLIDNLIEERFKHYKAISDRILKVNSVYQKENLFKDLETTYNVIKELRGINV